MSESPKAVDNKLYEMLQNEQIEEFNAYRAAGHQVDLRGALLRGLDLRGLNVAGLDLQDCYFRSSDLRGVDFRDANLEGASMAEAQISGCYFPESLTAEELRMSIELGTRMRMRR
ncbi:MAG: hypothetical protein CL940_01965 [Deltaproteobacteria bacterium]|nr:hypothetical protein [Deltaproteobacteria bacterium]